MKTAIVCIAKNEDNYIDEWIKYHTKLGFDCVYVYQNDWRYAGDKSQFGNVHWLELDGRAKQLEAYNNFLKYHSSEYDWAAFFDVDEMLCLKHMPDVKSFLASYDNYNAVAVNWRLFGNNAHICIHDNDYSLINRFRMAEYTCNKHVKTIVHTSKTCSMDVSFVNPHFVKQAVDCDFTVNTAKTKFVHGPFNEDFDDTAQLNHYYCKTLDEYLLSKRARGRNDPQSDVVNGIYDIKKFSEANKNDIEDLRAFNFWNDLA